MPSYNILSCTFDELKVSERPEKDGKYKYFLLVNAEDGKQYQVKLNEDKQRHNVNEFISHFVGRCSDMPLLSGEFLSLDDEEIEKIKSEIDSYRDKELRSYDFSLMKENVFFGIEWMQHLSKIDNEVELMKRVGETSNKYSFFGLYSFDQFMKNYDRHLGNHLVVKIGSSKQYKLIDFDRIFSGTNWSRVHVDFKCFTPFVCTPYAQQYHGFLMHIVRDSHLKYVHLYSGKIQSISTENIKGMYDIITQIYAVSSDEIDAICQWLEYRKKHIVMECLINEKHFPNVRKGLLSVS